MRFPLSTLLPAPLALLLLALVLPAAPASADRLSTIPHDPAMEAAVVDEGLRRVAVRHEGWNETLSSWARIKLNELTGRQRLPGQDPAYTVLSMIYEREKWQEAKFLPIEHPRIGEVLGIEGRWASPRQLVDSPGLEKLRLEASNEQIRRDELRALEQVLRAVEQAHRLGPDRPGVIESVSNEVDPGEVRRLLASQAALNAAHDRRKELQRRVREARPFLSATERLFHRLVVSASLGDQLLIAPDTESSEHGRAVVPGSRSARLPVAADSEYPEVEWLSPRAIREEQGVSRAVAAGRGYGAEEIVPASYSEGVVGLALASRIQQAALDFDASLARAFSAGDAAAVGPAASRFLSVVELAPAYPSRAYRAVKEIYTRHNPYKISAWIYALAAALLGLNAFFRARPWWIAGMVVLGAGMVFQTTAMGMRLYLTGHIPVSNMFESIVFATWSALGIGLALELWKRQGLFGLAAALVGFVALIGAAQMPLHDARIHPLRAVLNSYWLNIHVTAMLLSYGAFMVSCALALVYLAKWGWSRATGREQFFGKSPMMPLEQIELLAYRLVQIGWPVLTVGIMLGAVWADTAWGRYWGWDPKETWSLITWITYTIYLHIRMVMGKKGHISALMCVLGFFMVLVTWLGVSYIPWFAGGLHTYASPG